MSCMNARLYIGGIIFLVLFLLASGCSQPSAAPIATPSVTPPSAVAAATTAALSTPGPTDTLPSSYLVDVKVSSNGQATNPQIILTFNGGNGMPTIPEIDFQVTRTDGVVETGKLTQPLSMGDTVSLAGTTGNNDRAEVWVVTPPGDRVKIIDQYVPFRSY